MNCYHKMTEPFEVQVINNGTNTSPSLTFTVTVIVTSTTVAINKILNMFT